MPQCADVAAAPDLARWIDRSLLARWADESACVPVERNDQRLIHLPLEVESAASPQILARALVASPAHVSRKTSETGTVSLFSPTEFPPPVDEPAISGFSVTKELSARPVSNK